MIIIAVLLSSWLVPSLSTHPLQDLTRRQFMGYTTNIFHENPKYPDQAAQSTINVNFNPSKPMETRHVFNTAPYQGLTYPTTAPQSQSFNVGYSVSFKDKPKTPKYVRPSYDGEIITGTRKGNEAVQIPQVYTQAKLKKPYYPASKEYSLSPNSQKFYKAIEQVHPAPKLEDVGQRYHWVSPSTEMGNVALGQFDHAKALGRSQEFDHTNAVDAGAQPQYLNPKVPLQVDTSLLREQPSVQIDTRYLDEVMRNLYKEQQGTTTPVRHIPVHETPEPEQARYQYQMYGKPKALSLEETKLRHPRLVDLSRNLRPPPVFFQQLG